MLFLISLTLTRSASLDRSCYAMLSSLELWMRHNREQSQLLGFISHGSMELTEASAAFSQCFIPQHKMFSEINCFGHVSEHPIS